MRRSFLAATLVAGPVLAGVVFAGSAVLAQQDGIRRAILQRYDVPAGTAHETVLGTAEVAKGGKIARHIHHGVEMGLVLEGRMVLKIEGRPDLVLEAGQSYQIPAGLAHEGDNVGDGPAKVAAVYVVEKGKPFAEPR